MKKFVNPIAEGADPFLLYYEGRYYHYATSAPDGFTVHSSEDLVEWKDEGYCLKAGEGVMGDKWFWAPEVKQYKGKFYMVYVANEHLAVAVADKPTGPFTCPTGKWLSERNAIDGSFFIDDDGKIYLYYVRFDGGNVIYGAPMKDMFTLDEQNERELVRACLPWETKLGNVAEGPFMLKHKGKYYLTYTANDFRSQDYAVGYAVCDTPLGNFVKYEGNPILKKDDVQVGTGHHSFTTTRDGKNLLIVYHVHKNKEEVHPRFTCVDRAEFIENPRGGDDILKINVCHEPQSV